MAKRTNKTDHVLNLLATGKKNNPSEAEKEEPTSPPVDPEPKQETKEEPEPKKHEQDGHEINNSSVSVVHMSADGENPIADSVKESLEEELDAYLQKKEETEDSSDAAMTEDAADPSDTTVTEDVPGPAAAAGEEEAAGLESEEKEDAPEEAAVIKEAAVSEETEDPQESNGPVAEDEAGSEPEAVLEEAAVNTPAEETETEEVEAASEPEVATEAEEPVGGLAAAELPGPDEAGETVIDYETVNVMEYLVRDKVKGYMTQFDNCTCRRCVEDTVALTLTHLPSKYVVVNKNAVSPLLNFYEKKYAGQIIVEITKACMTVKEFPHHK